MKNILAGVLTLILVSSLAIGCDFVDSNPASAQFEDEPIESTSVGFHKDEIDTTGYENG